MLNDDVQGVNGNSDEQNGWNKEKESNNKVLINENNSKCMGQNCNQLSCCSQNSIMLFNTKTPEKIDSSTPYNPFHLEIGSLSMPSFSPSVFSIQEVRKSSQDESKDTFRWSIEQLAALHPADIDETFQQNTLHELDEKSEEEAQKAIQSFFLQNTVAPSPWGVAVKQVTFSPNVMPSTLNSDESEVFSMSTSSIHQPTKKSVWTQTALTIPNDVDLNNLLSQYFSFNQDQKQNDNSIDEKEYISSLRRKLFCQNGETVKSPAMAKTSDYKTPEKQSTKFLTPCSGHYSSSPISMKNFSISGLVTHSMKPFPISPISADRSDSVSPISGKNIKSVKTDSHFFASPDLRKSHLKSILKSSLPGVKSTYEEKPISINQPVEVETRAENGTQQHLQQSCTLSVSMLSDFSGESPEMDLHSETYEMIKSELVEPQQIQSFGSSGNNNNIAKVDISHCQTLMASQDLGYQTASSNSLGGMDTNSINQQSTNNQEFSLRDFKYNENSVNKPEILHPFFTKRFQAAKKKTAPDGTLLETSSGMDVEFRQRLCSVNEHNGVEMFMQDSVMHILQSSWKPSVYSTPH